MKLRELLEHTQENIGTIKADIRLIKQDIEYHIRRTDIAEAGLKRLELRIAPLLKIYHFLQVLGALIVVAAAVAGIARLFI